MFEIKFRGEKSDLEKLKNIINDGFKEALNDLSKYVDTNQVKINNEFIIDKNLMIYKTNFFDVVNEAIKKTYKNRILSFFVGKFIDNAKKGYIERIKKVIKENKLNVEII